MNTHHKTRNEESNMDPVEEFIAENLHEVPGEKIQFKEFYERFVQSLPPEEKGKWSRQKVVKLLPNKIQYGPMSKNIRWIGNHSWEPAKNKATPLLPLFAKDGKLIDPNTNKRNSSPSVELAR